MNGNSPFAIRFCSKQKPLQTREKRLTAVVLAPPARLELTTFRLGGGPSIPVRYGGLYNKYSIFGLNRIRTNCRLGGDRSIQLSYGGLYDKYSIFRLHRIRTNCRLGGERSILLSYRDVYQIYSIFPLKRIRTSCRLGGVCYIHLTTEAYKEILKIRGRVLQLMFRDFYEIFRF